MLFSLIINEKALSTTTGLTESKTANISVYPKPVIDELTVELPAEMNNAKISIYTFDGRLLVSQNAVSSQNVVNVNCLSSGCYIIKVTSASQTISQKFIKK